MANAPTEVQVKLTLSNPRAMRAIRLLIETLESVAEDFAYRDDVKRGLRAAKYLGRNLEICVDDADVEILLSNGCEFVDDKKSR